MGIFAFTLAVVGFIFWSAGMLLTLLVGLIAIVLYSIYAQITAAIYLLRLGGSFFNLSKPS